MFTIKIMQNISAKLEAIAAELDMIYIRALNVADLNQQLQSIDVIKPVLVYANLNPVEFPETGSNFEFYTVETEIYVLDRSQYADPTPAQIDAQLAPLFVLCNSIYDALTRWPEIYSSENIERGTVTPAEQIEKTDEILNGFQMFLTLPIQRNNYYCGP